MDIRTTDEKYWSVCHPPKPKKVTTPGKHSPAQAIHLNKSIRWEEDKTQLLRNKNYGMPPQTAEATLLRRG